MITLADILQALSAKTLAETIDWNDVVTRLQQGIETPDVVTFRKQYNVADHDINDKSKRHDKEVVDDDGKRFEPVVRVAVAYQQLINEKAAQFLFGLPPTLTGKAADEQEKTVLEATSKILDRAKTDGHNKELAIDCGRSTQVAECWYPVPVDKPHNMYGFSCKFKLRVARFSPWLGDKLYPCFDETGDMVAFCRGYSRVGEEGKTAAYFEIYTAKRTVLLAGDSGSWALVNDAENLIRKIPISFGQQTEVEWAKVQNIIDRLETNLSNHGEINDYHAAPTIISSSDIASFSGKGEKGRILITEGDVKYMTWTQAPDSVKLELDTDFMLIHKLTQTPDISFEAMKGLGDISGTALRFLFIDAHMKVEAKKLIFDPFLQRRLSIIAAYIGLFDKELADAAESLSMKLVIRPYQVSDLKEQIETLAAATAGKPIVSQQTAVEQLGLTDNPDDELKRLEEEAAKAATQSLFPPAVV